MDVITSFPSPCGEFRIGRIQQVPVIGSYPVISPGGSSQVQLGYTFDDLDQDVEWFWEALVPIPKLTPLGLRSSQLPWYVPAVPGAFNVTETSSGAARCSRTRQG